MNNNKLFFAVFSLWSAVVIYFYGAALPVNFGAFSVYLLGFAKNYSPVGFFNYAAMAFVELFLAAFLVVISFIIGRRVTRSLKRELDTPGFFIVSSALGFILITALVFILSAVGLLYEAVLYSLFILLCLFALYDLRKDPAGIKFEPNKYTGLERVIIVLLIVAVLLNLFCALTPETFYDSLLYHLGLSSAYLNAHSFIKTFYNIFSGFPGNAEMLFILGLALNGALTAKLINFLFGLLLLFGIYSFGKKYLSRTAGLLTALIFYSMPIVSANQVNTQVDIILTFYVFVALYLALLAKEKQFKGLALVLSGLLAGFAMGVKYSGLIYAAGISAVVFYLIISEKGFKNRTKAAAAFFFFALIPIVPWLFKNYLLFSNPFYPYLSGNPRLIILSAEQTGLTVNGVFDILRMPWSLTMSEPYASMNIGALLLMLMPFFVWLLFRIKKEKKQIHIMLLFLGVSLLLWLPATRIARFFLPGLLILTFASVYALTVFLKKCKDDYFTFTAYLVVIFMAGSSIIWSANINFRNMDPISFASGKLSDKAYLSAGRPTYPYPYYPAVDFINHQPGNEKVLFVGETRTFYCKKPFLACSFFDRQPLLDLIVRARAEGGLKEVLKNENILWMLVNYGELERNSDKYGLNELVTVLDSPEFLDSVTPVFRRGKVVVYMTGKLNIIKNPAVKQ